MQARTLTHSRTHAYTRTLVTLLALVVMHGLTLAAWVLERRHGSRP